MAQVDDSTNEPEELRRCLRDLVALSTLPAIWVNHDGRQIADSVAEALVGILGLEFVYVSAATTGTRQIEVTRVADRGAADHIEQVRESLASWIGSSLPTDAVTLENPVGVGTVRVFFLPIGFPEPAIIVAGSRSQNFPSRNERLLLTVTANQMSIALRRRGAEEAVRQSEERFRQLADAMPQIVWMAQPDGHVDYYNQRWYDFTGFPQGQTGFEGWRRLLHTADLRPCIETWKNSVRTGDRYEIECRFLDRISRRYRWHLGRALPVRDEHGNITRWFGTCTDIDEQKRAAEELEGLTQTLENRITERTRQLEAETAERERAEAAFRQAQKMEALGQLTGGVAHDFNNLLLVISTNLAILRIKGTATDVERQLDAIERAAHRGAGLTRQLLAFSRRQPLRPTVIDLNHRVPKLVDLMRASLRGDIEIEVESDPDLWPIETDPSELELALLNIAVNARDAMPKGGTLALSIRNKRLPDDEPSIDGIQDGSVVFTIRDTGMGIPAETLPRVFEPFFTTKEIGKGTGLGLSQVYGFVKQSGGTVALNSEAGKGTTITLAFPRSTATLLPPDSETAVDHTRLNSGSILIVEDNDEVAEVTATLLEHIGYRIHRACSATEALRMLTENPFDLVFTDIVMPGGMSGLDLARAVRQRYPGLPVLLTTGYSAAAREATGDGFPILSKPYHRNALEQIVASIVAGKESQERSSM